MNLHSSVCELFEVVRRAITGPIRVESVRSSLVTGVTVSFECDHLCCCVIALIIFEKPGGDVRSMVLEPCLCHRLVTLSHYS